MKKRFLFNFVLFLFYSSLIQAQVYTETFEGITGSGKPTVFNSNGQSFTAITATPGGSLGGLFGVYIPTNTWTMPNPGGGSTGNLGGGFGVGTSCTSGNCTGVSDKFLDNGFSSGTSQVYSIKTTDSRLFSVSSVQLFFSSDNGNNNAAPGSVIINGKKAGVTVFIINKTSVFITGFASNNGFNYINFMTEGGADNTNKYIDEIEFRCDASVNYFAVDNFTWEPAPLSCTTLPDVVKPGNLVACNGASSQAVLFSGSVPGTVFNWVNSDPSIGLAASGSGDIVSFTAVNTTNSPVVATVTVTPSFGACLGTPQSFTITVNPTPGAVATPASQTICSAASISPIILSGTVSGTTYNWMRDNTTSATGIASNGTGNISGTLTNNTTAPVTVNFNITPTANSCDGTPVIATVTIGAPLVVTSSQTNISCNGGSNGRATVSISGGSGAYTYSWAPSGGTAATATGLTAGTYTCTITDANGCNATKTFTITQPAVMAITTSQTNVSCNGGSNGKATATVSGGTPGYTYSWSPSGGTGATATGLTVGTYTCTITDANGCTATRNFTITQPAGMAIGTAQANISCNGGSNGAAGVSVSGGTPGYTYSWSPSGGTAATATGLTAGTYTCTITDANGCTATRNFTITQPAGMAIGTSQANISCNGGSNGSAGVSVSGGTPGYTYSWAPSGGTAAMATGLSAGTYTCTITDANGCTTTKSFTITQPAVMSITPSQTNVSCNGGSNGIATVMVSGGTAGYTYSWSPSGGTAATATGLTVGNYTCTITDANSCQTTRSFTITQPAAMAVTTSQTNVSCNGGSNASASVSVSGGTPAYTYSWSPSGGTAATATGLTVGTYTCTITDANGCTATRNFTITQPAGMAIATLQANISCNGGSNGLAGVSVSGGTPGYTYSWSPSGGTAAMATGLSAGTYTCTITDANGCTATKSFTLTQPAAVAVSSVNVPANGTYTGGDNLSFTINFNQNVIVNTAGGTPYIPLTLNTGGTVQATYVSGSGSSALVFLYTITSTNQDADGISVGGSIVLNGGTLQNSGGCAAFPAINGLPSTTGVLVHNPVSQTITFNALPNKIYGDADFDANATASSGLTVSYTSSNTAVATIVAGKIHIAGAGSSVITATQTGNSNYLAATAVSQTLTVNPKAIAITAQPKNKTYGNVDPALTYIVSPALISGDSFAGELSRAAGEGVGAYAINQNTLALSSNYAITYNSADLTINKKAVTVTADAKTKIYGDADPALTYIVSPALISSDAFTGELSRAAGEGVGAYAINQNTLALSSNYAITYTSADLTITKKAVTVTADARTKIYGDADPAFTYTASPALVSGDVFTGELSRTAGEDVGAYAINQNTLALNSNYAITYTSADLTISKKAVTVTADAKAKIYGDADPALTYIVSPALISGDAFSGELSRTAGEDVGAYAINQNTLALNGNYTITYTSADLTINKKAVTVTADAKTKVYGDADPALTYIVSPALISGDAFSGELSRTAGEDVGTYPITQGSLANGNYAISFVNGVLTIDKAAQQITWNQTLIAGCDGSANIVLTATASSGLTVNYQSGNAAVATINGNQLLIAGPGTTMITATQAGNNNYLPAVLVQNELTSKLPAHLVVKRWDDVLVFDNSSKQYTAWQWYKNSGAINGATGQYYYESGKLNGDYYAVVKTAAGTTLQTCPVTITPGSTFIPIAIFPNPVDPGQSITVKTSYTATQLQGATIVVSNIQGVIVQTLQNVMPQTNITMPVVQGFYVIRLKLSDGTTASVNALVKPQ